MRLLYGLSEENGMSLRDHPVPGVQRVCHATESALVLPAHASVGTQVIEVNTELFVIFCPLAIKLAYQQFGFEPKRTMLSSSG
jgi:hypothetical protein